VRFLACKRFGTLRPVDQGGEDALREIANGALVQIEVKRPRNINHHRLYFALVSLVWDNIDHDRYPSVEDLHGAIKIAAGLRTRIELPDGTQGFMPGSIAFHKMSQDDFSAFYTKVCDLVARHFLPGVNSEDLKREVESMIGVAA
jgi:hypothetical protein